jgi:hypothetical protein
VNDEPHTKRLAASQLSASTWRERFAIRLGGIGRIFDLGWFVWLPIVAAVGTMLVGLFLRQIGYIVISLIVGFSAFLMWAVLSQRDE